MLAKHIGNSSKRFDELKNQLERKISVIIRKERTGKDKEVGYSESQIVFTYMS